MGKKTIFTARFTQDAEHAEKKVVKNKMPVLPVAGSLSNGW
jgi:hypothetical protein